MTNSYYISFDNFTSMLNYINTSRFNNDYGVWHVISYTDIQKWKMLTLFHDNLKFPESKMDFDLKDEFDECDFDN